MEGAEEFLANPNNGMKEVKFPYYSPVKIKLALFIFLFGLG